MKPDIQHAIEQLAESEGWTRRTNRELGLLLWALFRYFARRATQYNSV